MAHRQTVTKLMPTAARQLVVVQPLVEPPESDAMLVYALRGQDLTAAGRLYDRYVTNVRGMVHRMLGPDAELDDVVQDVFVAAITSIGKLREPALLKSWLLGIAVGKVRDHLRTRWRRRWLSFLPNEELPERAVPSSESQVDIVQEVCSILDRLPPEERIALLLHRLEGLSLDEAAKTCSMSVSTFKRRVARAEAKFIVRAKYHPALVEWRGQS